MEITWTNHKYLMWSESSQRKSMYDMFTFLRSSKKTNLIYGDTKQTGCCQAAGEGRVT